MIVAMLTNVYIPIKGLERKVAQQNITWRIFRNGQREGTCVVPRCQEKSFMFRGNYFVATILSHNITITKGGKKAKNGSKGGRLVTGNICKI